MSNDKRMKPLLDEARQISETYNERATVLSKRIEAFEYWLRDLEFRVESDILFGPNENLQLRFNKLTLVVRVKRKGGQFEYYNPLTDCSVDIKIEAVKVFPDLLEKLMGSQREALSRVDAAHTALDEIAESVGHFEEEAN